MLMLLSEDPNSGTHGQEHTYQVTSVVHALPSTTLALSGPDIYTHSPLPLLSWLGSYLPNPL
jgi:hypothetical protein